MLKFFRIPFATSGDKTAVPDAVDINGNVSYTQGYGFDYQRQKTDPAAKNIERDKMNEIFFDITTALYELQSQGIPDFITSALNGGTAFSYAANAVVRYSGDLYLSLAATNTALPTDATKWALLPTAARLQASTYTAAVAGGTADALTATFTPAIAALPTAPATLHVYVRAASANATTTPTFSPNGLTAKTIAKGNNLPLVAGDIAGAGHWLELQFDATLDKWILQNPSYGIVTGNAAGLFNKADSTIVAFTKTGNFTVSTSQQLRLEVNGTVQTIAASTAVTMPTATAGTDYAIWAKPDGTLEATTNHTSPPVTGARRIGGFHYAPGGNATAQAGGDTTPSINAYSFWDLKFRPTSSDPRGMTLVGGGYWADIYLTGVDAITNGSSKYNVTMADGSSPPKVPTMFGGNGTTNYGSYTWFEAMELATAFGKRCPTQQEFMSLAYGTTEASSVGTDQNSTILNAAYTSKWGVIQATGVLYAWGRERGGPFAGATWNANTEGRGSEYNAPNSVRLGGNWSEATNAGSRCSYWGDAASNSYNYGGSRFVCDHLQLD